MQLQLREPSDLQLFYFFFSKCRPTTFLMDRWDPAVVESELGFFVYASVRLMCGAEWLVERELWSR
ncbi:hypothetical protein IMZ48_29720 [Candidatus Bathyarchaeota archaeon]|nr:hypothetical protein [Candidatus Bathyarchaeota archaeon]